MENWRNTSIYKNANGQKTIASLVEERALLRTYRDTGKLPTGYEIEGHSEPGAAPQAKDINWNGFG